MIKEFFSTAEEYGGDVYVADYTNATNSERGVEITDVKPEDIGSFHLKNSNKINYWGVNFENEQHFFEGRKQCECMFTASKAKEKPWVLLLETKYCLEKNIVDNSTDALEQLLATRDILLEKQVITTPKSRFYLNISVPEQNKEPFSSFRYSPSEIIDQLTGNRTFLLGYNSLLILNDVFIQVPKVEI